MGSFLQDWDLLELNWWWHILSFLALKWGGWWRWMLLIWISGRLRKRILSRARWYCLMLWPQLNVCLNICWIRYWCEFRRCTTIFEESIRIGLIVIELASSDIINGLFATTSRYLLDWGVFSPRNCISWLLWVTPYGLSLLYWYLHTDWAFQNNI